MNLSLKARFGVAIVAFSPMALPAAALAQTSAAGPVAQGSASGMSTPGMTKTMSAKEEQHIKQLHDQLQITPAEQPQWDKFAQVMRDNAEQMEQALMARGQNAATMTAVVNMQSYAKLTQVHADNMQKLSSAFQTLYNSFPAQQQKLADGVFQNKAAKHMAAHSAKG